MLPDEPNYWRMPATSSTRSSKLLILFENSSIEEQCIDLHASAATIVRVKQIRADRRAERTAARAPVRGRNTKAVRGRRRRG